MKLDGGTVVKKLNMDARSFQQVKIFAGSKWSAAAQGKMKNLIVQTDKDCGK